MRFAVVWLQSAESELTQLWLDAEDQTLLASAANDIDRLLRTSPLDVGESRAQGRRILLVRPLGVSYSISTEDRIVRVLHVWKY